MVVSEVRRRGSALLILAVLALVAMPAVRPIDVAAAAPTLINAQTTGYTWYDNTPADSNAICCGVKHPNGAGGTGIYQDPITIAVGFDSNNVMDIPAGTILYIPNVRRYFIVEDTCVGCNDLSGAVAGAAKWVDMWTGGGQPGDTQQGAQNCASDLTGGPTLHTLIENPPSTYPVVAGPLYHNGQCTVPFGNSIPGGGPAPPPPSTPPPSTPPPSTPPPSTPPPSTPPPSTPPPSTPRPSTPAPSTPAPTAKPGSHTPAPGSTPLPPVANASTPKPGAPGQTGGGGATAVPDGKHTPTGSSGSTGPSLTTTVRPLLIAAQGLLGPAALALLLTVAATAVWLLWRRRRSEA